MIKNFLIAAALVIASPALVFSQDLFISFDSASNVSSTTLQAGTSGTATLFSNQPFGFDALDLNISSSDSSVLLLTGGTTFNDPFPTIGGTSFDSSVLTADGAGNANLFAVNVTQNGVNPAVAALFNPGFEAGAGSGSGAVKLAELTFDLLSAGTADLTLSLGTQGALQLPDIILDPAFGTASVVVEGGGGGVTPTVPEPSSATLLVLGAVGMVARRRRARA